VSDLEQVEVAVRERACPGPFGPEPCAAGATVPVFVLSGVEFAPKCGACQAVDDERELAEARRARLESCRLELMRRLPAFQRGWTLESFADGVKGADLEALGRARAWLADLLSGDRHGLYLWGDVGRGKTGLAVGLARAAVAEAVEAWVVNWRDWLSRLRDSYNDASRRPEPLERVELLVLDDLGAERPTEHAREELATLVDRRVGARLPTVVTTNFRASELSRRLGHDDPVVGQRIVSRLVDGSEIVEVRGLDRRRPRAAA
jgi:DNA replication protein DnaC